MSVSIEHPVGASDSDGASGSTPRGSSRRLLRRLVLVAIGLLYVASVPWYRATDSEVGRIAGLPDWVAIALACYVAVAVLNGVAWLLTDVRDPDARERSAADSDPGRA